MIKVILFDFAGFDLGVPPNPAKLCRAAAAYALRKMSSSLGLTSKNTVSPPNHDPNTFQPLSY